MICEFGGLFFVGERLNYEWEVDFVVYISGFRSNKGKGLFD